MRAPTFAGFIAAVLLGLPWSTFAQAPTFTFFKLWGDDAPSPFSWASSLTVDSAGNLYLYVGNDCVIRKRTPAGVVSEVVGVAGSCMTRDGAAGVGRIALGTDLIVDGAGTFYFVQSSSHVIRRATAAGTVTTVAGTAGQAGGVDGNGPAARFEWPQAVARDSAGNLYVADLVRHLIRKITPAGDVTTLAGRPDTPLQGGYQDGPGATAMFDHPRGIAATSDGIVYVTDDNRRLRKITPDGTVSTLADFTFISYAMTDVATSDAGTIYVSWACGIYSVTPAGAITHVAGAQVLCGEAAAIDTIEDIAVGPDGNIYVLQIANMGVWHNSVRMVTPAGAISTVVPASPVRSHTPFGIAYNNGYAYVTDVYTVQRLTPAGNAFPLSALYSGNARGIAFDATGNGVVAVSCGIVRLSGHSFAGGNDPVASDCASAFGNAITRFDHPWGLAWAPNGMLYVADTWNSTIRAVTADGGPTSATTLAGVAGSTGTTDGSGTTARFHYPTGLAVDAGGTIYVADTENHTIRAVTAAGVVTTFAGQAGVAGSADGPRLSATFNRPHGLTFDSTGALYVADTGNSTIRRISTDGDVTTIGGSAGQTGAANGAGSAARFTWPMGLAFSSDGELYVADTFNGQVRVAVTGTVTAPSVVTHPSNVTVNAGTDAIFTVAATGSPTPGYQWQSGGGSSWVSISDGDSAYSGAQSATLRVRNAPKTSNGMQFRAIVRSIAGQTISNTATLTVNSLTATPATLTFATTVADGVTQNATPPQIVLLSYNGGAPTWTVSADKPFLHVSRAGGSGAGEIQVTVLPHTAPPTSNQEATITFTGSNGVTATVPVAVRYYAAATQPPTGVFDTPLNNATGLQGSIAVTGWALDDIGVDRVEIWRDVVAGETTPPYTGTGPGNGKIYIGNATFVRGARPDVAALYHERPAAHQAGWGYLLLTQGLWNRGNGTYVLHAFAYDMEGQYTTLGSKTIAVDNDSGNKPFGAIDTPAYGGTVSGTITNFGWALTPGSCHIANVYVSIDSGPLQAVTYGDARSDIAGAFTDHTDAAAAGGHFVLDTTTLTDGMHAIGWYVVDSCGRADGVGSRFFFVANGGSSLTAATIVRTDTPSDAQITPARSVRDGDVVVVSELERVELQLPRGFARYAIERAPPGAWFDATSGRFAWQPVAGMLGSYDLRFTAGSESVRVRAVIGPSMRMVIDTPAEAADVSAGFLLAGWAVDLAARDGSGVDTVHVWAYPRSGGAPIPLGAADVGGARPDVAALYGSQFERSAYELFVDGLVPGEYDIVVYPHSAVSNQFHGAQVRRVVAR